MVHRRVAELESEKVCPREQVRALGWAAKWERLRALDWESKKVSALEHWMEAK